MIKERSWKNYSREDIKKESWNRCNNHKNQEELYKATACRCEKKKIKGTEKVVALLTIKSSHQDDLKQKAQDRNNKREGLRTKR